MQKIQELLDSTASGASRDFSGLSGSALAYALVQLFRKEGRPLHVFLPTPKAAWELEEDLRFFLGSSEAVLSLPPMGILPYYGLSPNPEAVARRMAALHGLLQRREPYLALFSMSALTRRLPPKSIFGEYSDYVVAKEDLPREDFQKKLLAAGYLHVPIVEDPGTFCKRGGILDLYSPQMERPVKPWLWRIAVSGSTPTNWGCLKENAILSSRPSSTAWRRRPSRLSFRFFTRRPPRSSIIFPARAAACGSSRS
ncbi:MAG: hypothetical protein K8R69_03910 [Deltaproteobacteria bacterium]|nr:hypothetical protein [Deltaproteobacteria bacterium]